MTPQDALAEAQVDNIRAHTANLIAESIKFQEEGRKLREEQRKLEREWRFYPLYAAIAFAGLVIALSKYWH